MKMHDTKRRKSLLALGAAAIIVAGALLYRTPHTPELPTTIGNMALVHRVQGEQANEILNRMHDKEVTPSTNTIGMYAGGPRSAVVYLSVYPSEKEAQGAYKNMARRIENGNPIFTAYRSITIGNKPTSFCIGQGEHHYFFFHNQGLYWLAADSGYAAELVEELIGTR